MGSEMCIRDSFHSEAYGKLAIHLWLRHASIFFTFSFSDGFQVEWVTDSESLMKRLASRFLATKNIPNHAKLADHDVKMGIMAALMFPPSISPALTSIATKTPPFP